MSSTIGGILHYGDEEIMRMKQEEAERYERLQSRGTMPDLPKQYAEALLNRKERRRLSALSKSKGGSDNG